MNVTMRNHVSAAILSLRAAIVNLEAAKLNTADIDHRQWLQSAVNLASDAISEAQASIEPKA